MIVVFELFNGELWPKVVFVVEFGFITCVGVVFVLLRRVGEGDGESKIEGLGVIMPSSSSLIELCLRLCCFCCF